MAFRSFDQYIILRKTIDGYSDSISSLTFNTILTYISIHVHAFHTSRCLQSKCMVNLSHASMVKVQHRSKW